MNTAITAIIPAADFASIEDALAYAAALRSAAEAQHPGAVIEIEIRERQSGGGKISVEIDGDEDETAAAYLAQTAEQNA